MDRTLIESVCPCCSCYKCRDHDLELQALVMVVAGPGVLLRSHPRATMVVIRTDVVCEGHHRRAPYLTNAAVFAAGSASTLKLPRLTHVRSCYSSAVFCGAFSCAHENDSDCHHVLEGPPVGDRRAHASHVSGHASVSSSYSRDCRSSSCAHCGAHDDLDADCYVTYLLYVGGAFRLHQSAAAYS